MGGGGRGCRHSFPSSPSPSLRRGQRVGRHKVQGGVAGVSATPDPICRRGGGRATAVARGGGATPPSPPPRARDGKILFSIKKYYVFII